MKTNYHTHVKLCGHANGMSKDYIAKAIKLGYSEIGISDHGPIPREWMSNEQFTYNWLDRQMTVEEFENIYIPDLKASISELSNQISIVRGLEIEYVANKDDFYKYLLTKLDYLILGIHYFFVDGINFNSYENLDFTNIGFYADTIESALRTGFFSCLVHPDLFLYNYKSENGNYNEFDSTAAKVTHRIVQAAIKYNVPLEINCGGIRKGKKVQTLFDMQYLYPREEFWSIASSYDKLKVIIGEDVHDPNELSDDAYFIAQQFAIKHNFTVIEKMPFK